MIKSFRGKLVDGGQQQINLHTNDGKTGYRIVKCELMPDTPGANQTEAIVKIYTKLQTTIDALVDFSDTNLLAAIFQATSNGSNEAYAENLVTVFDQSIVNQDIFITAKELAGNRATNYYIELEQVKLDLNESTVATLQSIRSK